MKLSSPLVVFLIVGCRSGGPASSAGDAGATTAAAVDASLADVVTDVTDASVIADTDAGPLDAAAVRADGELTLDVQGAYCPADRRTLPECRSYTYRLRTDGKLTGGGRRTDVSREEVDAVFTLAVEAFAGKRSCIPNAPDRGGESISLRWNGKTETARGDCGPRLRELKKRLERLAAESG